MYVTRMAAYILRSASSLVTQPSALLSETARLPGQACHVPTTHTATLRHTRMGCSALAFSHSGRLLAAGCADHEDVYPLIIYEVNKSKLHGEEIVKFSPFFACLWTQTIDTISILATCTASDN